MQNAKLCTYLLELLQLSYKNFEDRAVDRAHRSPKSRTLLFTNLPFSQNCMPDFTRTKIFKYYKKTGITPEDTRRSRVDSPVFVSLLIRREWRAP